MIRVTTKNSGQNGFFRKVRRILTGFKAKNSSEKKLNKAVSKAAKPFYASKMQKKAVKKQGRNNMSVRKLAARKAKPHIRRHRVIRRRQKVRVRATVKAYIRPAIRKEIMMPAPWSRVEKYKKVRKEGFYYNE